MRGTIRGAAAPPGQFAVAAILHLRTRRLIPFVDGQERPQVNEDHSFARVARFARTAYKRNTATARLRDGSRLKSPAPRFTCPPEPLRLTADPALPMTRPILPFFAVLATVLGAASGPSAPTASGNPRLSRSEHKMIRVLNSVRSQHGLRRLRPSRALNLAADAHSGDMLARNFFAHDSSDGTPIDRRLRRYANARTVGENLAALGRRPGLEQTVVRMWMNSPPHRAVMLSPGFRRIGIAHRSGILDGFGMSVVTADFASQF
jgi:uncharacterized protein YkwD